MSDDDHPLNDGDYQHHLIPLLGDLKVILEDDILFLSAPKLAEMSSEFARMLQMGERGRLPIAVELPDMPFWVWDIIVSYTLESKNLLTKVNASYVMGLCNKYEITAMQELYEMWTTTCFTLKHCVSMFRKAKKEMWSNVDEVQQFVASVFPALIQEEEFLEQTPRELMQLVTLLRGSISPTDRCRGILRWVEFRRPSKAMATWLLKREPFQDVSKDLLYELLTCEFLVFNNEIQDKVAEELDKRLKRKGSFIMSRPEKKTKF